MPAGGPSPEWDDRRPVATVVGTLRAPGGRVVHDTRLLLAIRTIVVTTRVAVAKNAESGRPLRVATARRGLAMLAALGEEIGSDAPRELREAFDAGRRELVELAGGEADLATPISIVGDDEDGVAADALDDRRRLGG